MNGSGVAARAGSTPAAVVTSARTSAVIAGSLPVIVKPPPGPRTSRRPDRTTRMVVAVGRPRGARATRPGGASAPAVAVEPARSGTPPASPGGDPSARCDLEDRDAIAGGLVDEIRACRTAEHGRAGILGQRGPPAGGEVDGLDRAGESRTGRADDHAAARHAQARTRATEAIRPPRSRDRAPGRGTPPSRTTTRRAARPPRSPGPWRTSAPAPGPVPGRRARGSPARRSSVARRRGPPGSAGPRGARRSSRPSGSRTALRITAGSSATAVAQPRAGSSRRSRETVPSSSPASTRPPAGPDANDSGARSRCRDGLPGDARREPLRRQRPRAIQHRIQPVPGARPRAVHRCPSRDTGEGPTPVRRPRRPPAGPSRGHRPRSRPPGERASAIAGTP